MPNGKTVEGAASGNLVITDSWPGQMRTVYGDHQRFVDTYFKTYPGTYFTGDGCRRDEDGYWWITGRVDDVINVSGHRLGTAEVELALVAHTKVSEAAVVGYPHPIKGQGIYAYVTLMAGEKGDEALRKDLVQWVRKEIGPFAAPDLIQFAPGLPKTRSGKIMRRILRKIAEDDFSNLGDTSTLADPAVVDDLVAQPPEQGDGVGQLADAIELCQPAPAAARSAVIGPREPAREHRRRRVRRHPRRSTSASTRPAYLSCSMLRRMTCPPAVASDQTVGRRRRHDAFPAGNARASPARRSRECARRR